MYLLYSLRYAKSPRIRYNECELIRFVFQKRCSWMTDQSSKFCVSFIDYGMLESWRCKQVFMLNQNIPDDRYYLSVNGMLYLDEQEPLSPEKYCIENVLTPNGSTIVSKPKIIKSWACSCIYSFTGLSIPLFRWWKLSATRKAWLLSLWSIDFLRIPCHNFGCLSINTEGKVICVQSHTPM